MPRDPTLRVKDILDALTRIQDACHGQDRGSFCSDMLRVRAVAFDFVVIGEASSQVPPDVQALRPDIPWSVMRGMRNRLAHEYFALSAEVLWETAIRDVPPLLGAVRGLLLTLERSPLG